MIYASVSDRDSRGNDTLMGGAGTDTLYGGGGDDTYYPTGADVFEDSDDYNLLNSDAAKFWLYGKGPFISTAARGVNITSAAGANCVTTTQFNDTLNAGFGQETTIGLGGDDNYVITGDRATVVEVKGGGYDTVYTDLLTYVLEANVEAQSGTQFASPRRPAHWSRTTISCTTGAPGNCFTTPMVLAARRQSSLRCCPTRRCCLPRTSMSLRDRRANPAPRAGHMTPRMPWYSACLHRMIPTGIPEGY